MGVATGLAIAGAASSAYGAYEKHKEKKAADKALKALQQPQLSNPYKNLAVSTLGSDLQREQLGRDVSTQVDALRESGTRGIIGGVGKLQSASNDANQRIAADLDSQQKAIDMQAANDETRIQGINEGRHINDVNALSSQYNAANLGQQQLIGSAISQAGTAALGFDNQNQMPTNNLNNNINYNKVNNPNRWSINKNYQNDNFAWS